MLKRVALAACLWRSALPENAEDRCAHVAFEDVAFAAEFLRSEGVDATPAGWPGARRRVLNYDARACPDPAAPYVATGFRARNRPRKVFGVGLSKTGTTSLHNALLSVGFSNSDMADEFWPAVVDAASEADVLEFWAGGEAARRGSAVAARTKRLFARHTGGTDLGSRPASPQKGRRRRAAVASAPPAARRAPWPRTPSRRSSLEVRRYGQLQRAR